MRSAAMTGVAQRTRRASRSTAAHVLARAGLTARGVIYILIGWVAFLVAIGRSSREADQQGAPQLLAGSQDTPGRQMARHDRDHRPWPGFRPGRRPRDHRGD